MNSVLKKIAVFALTVSLMGCNTLDDLLDGIIFSISGKNDSVSTETPIRSTSLPTRISRSYAFPKSYDTAYSYRTDTPFQNMRNISPNIDSLRANNPDEYIRQVVAIIKGSAKNDFEKIKMAHDIVSLLVKYDATSYWARTIPEQSYRNVLKTRLAVCEGYANTFKKFCDELNIPNEVIHGFGRGVGTSPLASDSPTDSNHAWNIVTIYGENYLIDCTWDSGFMEGRMAKQAYSTDWLFLKPEYFIYTHYPKNAIHQLLSVPLTPKQFSSLPFLEPKYFEIVQDMSIELQRINHVDNSFTYSYAIKDGYYLSYSLYDTKTGREILNRTFTQREELNETVNISFPYKGQYGVNIYWWKIGARRGEGCGEFIIEAASASLVQYPTTFISSGKNLKIISPIEMPLKRGNEYTFRVHVDNKRYVAIVYGRTFIHLENEDDTLFSIEFKIPNNINELSIAIADSKNGRYETIAEYIVK